MKPGPEFAAGLLNAGAVFVATGNYDKGDAFLASVPQGSEFVVPALFWRLTSSVMRGDLSLVSSCSERLLSAMDMDAWAGWMETAQRSPIFKDKTLLPSSDPGFLKAVEERAQDFFEFQKIQEENPVTVPSPARLTDLAPALTSQ